IEYCGLSNAFLESIPYGSGAGISLYNVENGRISHVGCVPTEMGIVLIESRNVVIETSNLDIYGVGVLLDYSWNISVLNCTIQNGLTGVSLYYSDHNLIVNNTISNFDLGMYLGYSDENIMEENSFDLCNGISMLQSNNNTITTSSFEHGYNGIDLESCMGTMISDSVFEEISNDAISLLKSGNTSISSNNFTSCGQVAVISGSRECRVDNNTMEYLTNGVRIIESSRCWVEDNTIYDVGYSGVHFDFSDNCTVARNVCRKAMGGTYIYASENITVQANRFTLNMMGLYIIQNHDLMIIDNDFNGNDEGLKVMDINRSLFERNNCSLNNLYGILLDGSDGNLLRYNALFLNRGEGMILHESHLNVVYSNIFEDNMGATSVYDPAKKQGRDTATDNYWNSTESVGNYWSDWLSPDSDGNGIVDNPYSLMDDDRSHDYYPMASLVLPPKTLEVGAEEGYATLTWQPSDGGAGSEVTGYQIVRTDSDGVQSIVLVPGNTTSFTDENVLVWDEYSYQVYAINSFGRGQSSNFVTIQIPDSTSPWIIITSPYQGSSFDEDQVDIAWSMSDAGSGISNCTMRIDSGSWADLDSMSNYTISNLDSGDHVVEVKVYDRAGNSASDSVTFIIEGGIGSLVMLAIVMLAVAIAIVAVVFVWRKKR
ncbi:MAG TPA: right-handed parallel beta-helix repeat-containing protein, partial [Methanomassiliicoccales archaeon]|nr:right-handed parallel beta-helix repeat-containing protein [Methanomassiliicoccales archaeon]